MTRQSKAVKRTAPGAATSTSTDPRAKAARPEAIDQTELRDRAKRLAEEWRRFSERATIRAQRAEWYGSAADDPRPAPFQGDIGQSKVMYGVSCPRAGVQPRRTETALFALCGDELERRRLNERFNTLAQRSAAVMGLPTLPMAGVGPSPPDAWLGHLFNAPGFEWWTWSGGELSGPLAIMPVNGERFGTIFDLAAASADALEHFAAGLTTPDRDDPEWWTIGQFPPRVRERVEKAASPNRKSKRVRMTKHADGTRFFSAADARRWWPRDMAKGI